MKSLILFAIALLCLEATFASKLKPQFPKKVQHYMWDSLENKWTLSQTRTREFENKRLKIESTFDEVGKSNLFKDSIVYEGDLVKSRYKFIWNPTMKDYENHYKIEYCTFLTDEECGQVSYSWDSEKKDWQVLSGWENSYTFTDENKKQFVIRNEFNPVTRTWDYKEKTEYEYYVDGKVKVQTNYSFDEETRQFNPVNRINYFKYSDSIPEEYNYEYNQFGSWIELLKFSYKKVGNLHIVTNYHLIPIEDPNLKARKYIYEDGNDNYSQMDSIQGENGWRLIKDFNTSDTLNTLIENTFSPEGNLTFKTREVTKFNSYGLTTEKLNYAQNIGSDEFIEFGNRYNHIINSEGLLLQTITEQYNIDFQKFDNVDKLVYSEFDANTSVENEENNNVLSYNYTTNTLTINANLSNQVLVKVFDLTGRLITTNLTNQNELQLNLTQNITYLVIADINGKSHFLKLLK
jgi:hypothetical protein